MNFVWACLRAHTNTKREGITHDSSELRLQALKTVHYAGPIGRLLCPNWAFVNIHQAWVHFSLRFNFWEQDSAGWCSAHFQHSARFPGRRHWPPFSQDRTLFAELWLPLHLCQLSSRQSEVQQHHHWLRSGWCKMLAASLLEFWGRNPSQCGQAAHSTHQFSETKFWLLLTEQVTELTEQLTEQESSPLESHMYSPSIQSWNYRTCACLLAANVFAAFGLLYSGIRWQQEQILQIVPRERWQRFSQPNSLITSVIHPIGLEPSVQG